MTRIGVIVDGEAEYRSLPRLYPRIPTPCTLLNPLKADIQPLAPLPQIAASVKIPLKILRARNVDLAIVMLDLETRDSCPGVMALDLEHQLARVCAHPAVKVVVKNRTFENWLVSDLSALDQLPGRFRITPGQRRLIEPNKADRVDALALVKTMVRQRDYSKVKDATQILGLADPLKIAANSRSFRRFARLIENPPYRSQSRRPAV